MVFSSLLFLFVFLPVFFGVYYILPSKWRNAFILLASMVFYAWGAPQFIFVLLASTFLDFYLVRLMHKTPKGARKKGLLALSIVLNLGLLAYFKYANFFVENLQSLLTLLGASSLTWTEVALPIGISFYTFQTLTYSIDIYRGKHAPLDRASDYLMYIMMFPQMIAGPIVRYSHVVAEIRNREESWDMRFMGLCRFAIGLGKKVLIANALATVIDPVFDDGSFGNLGVFDAWILIVAYAFQIYFDFSGYSDMAIGLGKMMGFRFPENFNVPYISQSITEFWRRWHITLGTWMRDYLYIPLGGNRGSLFRVYFNLALVFLVSGFWHGASWNFVLWGAFHGLFLILDRLFLLRVYRALGEGLSVLLTFTLVLLGWVVFRIEAFPQALDFYKALFGLHNAEPMAMEYSTQFALILGIAVWFAFFPLWTQGKITFESFSSWIRSSPKRKQVLGVVCLLIFWISASFLQGSDFNPFIYFRF